MIRRALLVCGILASLLYAGMNVFVALQWEGYSFASQTVSELSAIEAPTRALWVLLGTFYALFIAAFGFGVWDSAGQRRPLRVAATALIVHGVLGLAWPPMHQRAILASGNGTLTDILHIVWSMITVVLMLLAIGFAAAAFEHRFRLYSVGTILILIVFGALTTLDAPKVSANLPTPWIGVWERINIGAFLLWLIVFAVLLLRARDSREARDMETAHEHFAAI